MSAEFTLVLDAQYALGESPVWRSDAGLSVFVDITGSKFDVRDRIRFEDQFLGPFGTLWAALGPRCVVDARMQIANKISSSRAASSIETA